MVREKLSGEKGVLHRLWLFRAWYREPPGEGAAPGAVLVWAFAGQHPALGVA